MYKQKKTHYPKSKKKKDQFNKQKLYIHILLIHNV